MIRVTDSIQQRVIATYGRTYEAISKISATKTGLDVLDEEKIHDQIALFCQSFGLGVEDLRGKRLLEVGSGFGVFLAVARRDYGIESFGVEPASVGFDSSREIAREVLGQYAIDSSILIDAKGEDLPFPDGHFDLIFSSNVLEHTEDPQLVIEEALRVLKPGGRMQFVFPNYGAFFEGHYSLPWIPYMGRSLGKAWVRLWGRNPAYIDTLRLTNYFSTRRWMRDQKSIRIVSYGERTFRERMLGLKIKTWGGLERVKRWLDFANRMRLVRPLTWILLRVRSFDPIILSLEKLERRVAPLPPDNRSIYEVRWTDWTDMKVYGPTSRWLRALIGDQLRRISVPEKAEQVLDFGCGEGTTTHFLATKFKKAQVLGIDRSAAGIHCARDRYRRSNLEFICQEKTSAVGAGSFFLVTCFEVLEHVEDWRALVSELARLSSRYVLVSFPTGRMREFERNVGHLRNFRRGQFERFAATRGLDPVSIYYAGLPFYSPVFRQLCNIFNSGGNSLTIGRYTWIQKRMSDVIFFLFRYLSLKTKGDQFCGLFAKRQSSLAGAQD